MVSEVGSDRRSASCDLPESALSISLLEGGPAVGRHLVLRRTLQAADRVLPVRLEESSLDEEGLLCEARSRQGPFDIPLPGVEGGGENRRLVEDYCYLLYNWR